MDFFATSPSGLKAKWITRGATLAELHVPDARGQLADVVLGFDDEAGYRTTDNQHFGCVTGRFANRIYQGKFILDGREVQLPVNKPPNHQHGGFERTLAKVEWAGEPFENASGVGVRFHYTSPDGEEGYPGALDTVVVYTLTSERALVIDYEATTDKPTVINLTNHTYFNLSGHGSPTVLDHEIRIAAAAYTPKDENSIPTGEIRSVAGTPLDFRTQSRLGERIGELAGHEAVGYDHNFVLDDFDGHVRLVAELWDPASGRVMRVRTDQPGMQLYTGNHVWGQTCKAGRVYHKHASVCLETQHFPDSPNKPHFPSTILRPGEVYRQTCIYEFDAE
jgi:aldose 1-epimerase